MRIGIDARWIFPENSGIGVHTRELIAHLGRLDTPHRFVLFFQDPAMQAEISHTTGVADNAAFDCRRLPYNVLSLKTQLLMPALLRKLKIDVFHSTNYMFPLLSGGRHAGPPRCVVTIHDVIPMLFPAHSPKSRKSRFFWLYKRLMLQIGKRAHHIIAVSHTARADILRLLHIPESAAAKVHVIPDAVSEVFCPANPAATRQTDTRVVLYVGRADPYKNLVTLIDAFAAAARISPTPLELRIVGSRDARYPEAERRAARHGIQAGVHWTGYVSEDQLVREYQDADVFVLPSRYEGFGMIALEAMACGTPVICSDGGALPEVVGDAAVVLEPDDVQGFATSILRVLSDKTVAADLVRRGLARAREFCWKRVARETLKLYEECAGNDKQ